MHVIERVLDRFQEGCSGCVDLSIGPTVRQIKWYLSVFKGTAEFPSDFTGDRQPSLPSWCWSCQSDTGLLLVGSRCVPNSFKVLRELSLFSSAASESTN